MGYSPNITAQRLQKRRTDTLGFITPTFGPRFSDPFFSEFMAGIGNEAASKNYDLLVSTHAPDSEEEQKVYRRAVKGGWVDRLIVVRIRENDARIQLLCEHDFPFVAFGRARDDLDFPYADEDSESGMRLLVQHFIDLGHRRIGLIAPPPGLMFGHYRLQSFYDTMRDNNLTIQPEWIVEGDLTPPVTTIHQPIYEIGQETCAMLIDIVNGRTLQNPHVLLTPTLVARASSNSLVT
jgi:LacI family transcriptional regulator